MTSSSVYELSGAILDLVLQYQRKKPVSHGCNCLAYSACMATHLNAVEFFVSAHRPVQFILPGFPGKSPNVRKVLGYLPDKAESLALIFLNDLCKEIKKIYAPGAQVIICSDGRVFSDLVQIPDAHITAYQQELRSMINTLGLNSLSLFNLDDVEGMASVSHDQMRQVLITLYAESLDTLKSQVARGEEMCHLYRAITRFLFEDGNRPDYTGSRSALQRDARIRAYRVIQRSDAWSRLLLIKFPNAVRWSIHPQACGAKKLGIHLMKTTDNWLTPWHGVAVDFGDRFALMKRADAEKINAELIWEDGRPSHYLAPNVMMNISDDLPHVLTPLEIEQAYTASIFFEGLYALHKKTVECNLPENNMDKMVLRRQV